MTEMEDSLNSGYGKGIGCVVFSLT